nr:hypothetical protein [Sphingobium sp. Z007]
MPASPTLPGASSLAPPGKPGKRDPKDYARFDALREPMLTTQFPGLIDTIVGDSGEIRDALADRGIGIEMQSATAIQMHLTPTGMPGNPQVYNGQTLTLRNNALNIYVTKKLDDIGLGDTMLTVGGGYSVTSFDPNGRNSITFKTLSLYHGFANRTVEVKAGFLQNYLHFAGLITGGNPTLTTGLVSLLPVQAGLSAEPATTPGVNVQINGKKGFYVLGGVQRSLNPLGIAGRYAPTASAWIGTRIMPKPCISAKWASGVVRLRPSAVSGRGSAISTIHRIMTVSWGAATIIIPIMR